jgi:hypothetical protein
VNRAFYPRFEDQKMAIELLVKVTDEGRYGVKLQCFEDRKPVECPGLGGWKVDGNGWWTNLIGEIGQKFLQQKFLKEPFEEFVLVEVTDRTIKII